MADNRHDHDDEQGGWFARWVRRNLPTREALESNRFVRPFASRILRADLWHFNRRSVPRGVALGVLVGIIVPIAQIIVAAFLALPVRANVPVAGLTTFITNPFTTPLIWVFSYKVGEFLLRVDAMTYGQPLGTTVHGSEVGDWMQWLTGAASITAFGLVVVAVVSAAIGYLIASFGWRSWIFQKRRRRLAKRARRLAGN